MRNKSIWEFANEQVSVRKKHFDKCVSMMAWGLRAGFLEAW